MIAWGIDTLIGFSLALLLVLAARRPVARHFGAGWAYALWLLPLAQILVALLPAPVAVPAVLPAITIVIPAAGAAAAQAPVSGDGQWMLALIAMWAAGAAAFILCQAIAYALFLRRIRDGARPGEPASVDGVAVFASRAVDGPLAFGILRRRIFVPVDFQSRYTPEERRFALAHERLHHRRGDPVWIVAALGLLALNWPNPFAWLAFRAFRDDQELSCDAAIAGRASAPERSDYAHALVKSASRTGLIAACPLNRATQLKRRLRMLKQHRASRARALGGTAALGLVLASGLVLGSPGIASAETPAKRTIVVKAPKGGGVIDEADIARLGALCGEAATGPTVITSRDGVIQCANGTRVDSPEAREIMARTEEKARAHAEIAGDAAADAMKTVRSFRIVTRDGEGDGDTAAALEKALEDMHGGDATVIRVASAEGALAGVREALAKAQISDSDRAEIEAALAEARTELGSTDFNRIMLEAGKELPRVKTFVIKRKAAE